MLVSLVALPFYLRFLGMEAYGLIGFYATLQAVLQVLDLGLAPTVSREIAHGAETGQRRRSASMLRTLGVVYIGVALLIAAIVALAAPWIGAHWLQAKALPDATVAQAVALMGVNLACRWPISLYHGALVGAHRLARSAATSMAINILAAITTIAVLAWGECSIQAFFVVQAAFGLLQAIVLRVLARRAVGERDAPYDFADLKRVWHFSAWMSGVAITSLVFTQLDKALLSRLIDLSAFGHYMLAALLVSGLSVLTGPSFNVIYPKFTTLHARGDDVALAKFYSDTSRMYAAAIFSLALALSLHVEALVTLWTGRADVALHVAPIVGLLAIGSALNGVMYFPYALQLAKGRPRIPLGINLGLLVLALPVIVWLATHYGAIGGALSWALLGVAYLFVGTIVTGHKVAGFAGIAWLARDIAVPLLIALMPALAGAWVSRAFSLSPWTETAIAILAACVGIAVGALYSPFARQQVLAFVGGRTRLCPN
ncbi:lipopolysaccharide biosynthesis protein [Lysobacter niastensis]|uniref:Lipopolysaccharide biosynthesis protein n=1 Tax=Lysobacter niastensis TaxID=380629 RepID=A0ABS0BAM8_9GAMM|nr:lipopolysaccharide biosynthesis protein [Lysobacter niastensis]